MMKTEKMLGEGRVGGGCGSGSGISSGCMSCFDVMMIGMME